MLILLRNHTQLIDPKGIEMEEGLEITLCRGGGGGVVYN